ncbi:MAG: helix-hairpin-helix domain-containing protein [Archangium sp.]|nr:helix-hairpin-helix domain-containing protein [Archangium sp.]
MRAVALAFTCFVAAHAWGAIYEQEIEADDEEDLFAAEQRGEISEETRDALLELLREGIDLNSASRDQLYDLPGITYAEVDAILAYRATKGRIVDPSELVAAGAISAEQFTQLAPFLLVEPPKGKLPVSGKLRLITQATSADNVPPPATFIGRLKGPFGLSAGTMLSTTRRLPATPRYDALQDTLVSDGFNYALNVPRVFVQWKSGKTQVVAGTYTIGFGERLTLDNTRRFTPKGIYLTDDFRRPTDLTRTCKLSGGDFLTGDCASGSNLYITPDHDWREVFRGVAASIEDVQVGTEARLAAYGFFSYQTRSIYQYELYDRRTCDDPRSTDSGCKAPAVFLNEGTATGSTRLIYSTLPYLYDEIAGGGHVDFRPSFRHRIGVTGYVAAPMFRDAGPMLLDFQEWSRIPGGGPYGTVGIDGQTRISDFNLHFEVARSFDQNVNGGGGFGAVQRSTYSLKRHELELSFRYYDDMFSAPLARPISGPDEVQGQRARNELGARFRYQGNPNKDWELRGRVDVWTLPFSNPRQGPAGTTNFNLLVRGDFTGLDVFQPGIWVDFRNRNVASSEHGRCSSGTVVYTEDSPFACSGDLYRTALRFEFRPLRRKLLIVAQSWLTFLDDVHYKDRFRMDFQQWVEVHYRPVEWLQFRARTRYLNQDTEDNTYLEQSLWSFIEAAWVATKGTRLSLRYDVYAWLDQRAVTLTRVPSPEHRFMLDVRTSF